MTSRVSDLMKARGKQTEQASRVESSVNDVRSSYHVFES